ncbi:urea ABC transporter ATP-binding protein UrtD [Arenibaculum sp.]|jgi:urea transport system ATP-binding protein|uniref:urea ABC transporter ATP-binding protein UrtD n=1 Tax=Arenibaculum sp. TaxID=2865862 RepID=UPI002E0FE85B|nr:urea ABC transporter ATP-binding protein UrtD [Arenibaculum sp.]
MTYLELHGLEVSFDGFKAVNGLDLSVARGELRCLLGANGAGKSTTMDLICGRTRPTGGRILLDGRDITYEPEYERARRGVGRKFQVPSVFKELTVRENLDVARSRHPSPLRTLRIFTGPALDDRVAEVVELVGLDDELDTRAGYLSHGQTQWLEIAMLLVQDSALILMDEPTAGMTIQETRKTSEIFNRLRGRHTLIVVEHDMAFVREIAQTITVLHQGRCLSEGTIAQVESDPRVKEAYLGSGGITHA